MLCALLLLAQRAACVSLMSDAAGKRRRVESDDVGKVAVSDGASAGPAAAAAASTEAPMLSLQEYRATVRGLLAGLPREALVDILADL